MNRNAGRSGEGSALAMPAWGDEPRASSTSRPRAAGRSAPGHSVQTPPGHCQSPREAVDTAGHKESNGQPPFGAFCGQGPVNRPRT
eukprot:3742385-Alexandrium_andersonii.AAC.1